MQPWSCSNIFLNSWQNKHFQGKGFPDLNTRLLVRLLTNTLKIPVFMIADADPHGMEIMCVYRYGSLVSVEYYIIHDNV